MSTAPDVVHTSPAGTHNIKLVYFAWVREKVGRADEAVEVPPGTTTIAGLVTWLQSRGPGYAAAFAKPAIIRAAIDHRHVKADASIVGAREIAFFPPVTGG